jgi:hypothetical protein
MAIGIDRIWAIRKGAAIGRLEVEPGFCGSLL